MIILCIILQLETLELEQPLEESSYIAELEELMNNPINPNRARIEDWLKIPFISPVIAYRLVEHRGQYKSLNDFSLAGLDSLELELLRPYVRIGKSYKVKRFRSRIRYQLKEYDTAYDYRLYSKVITDLNGFKTFLVTERDPGEKSYFDYLSYGLVMDNRDFTIGLGHYDIELGEGVLFSPEPYFFLRDYNFQSPRRGIIPYTSTSENEGLYGATISYKDIYAIFSRNYLDAFVNNDTVTGINYSGLHDDSSAIENKDLITEHLAGLHINTKFFDNVIGIKGYKLNYEPEIMPSDSLPFYGNDLYMTGIDLRRYSKYVETFGEVGLSNGSIGGIGGFISKLPFLSMTGAWSFFPDNFYSPHGGIVERGKNTIISNFEFRKYRLRVGLRGYYQLKFENEESYYDLRPFFENRFGNLETAIELRQRIGDIPSYQRGSAAKVDYKIKKARVGVRFLERHYPDSESSLYGGLNTAFSLACLRISTGIGSYSCPEEVLYIYEPDLPGRFNTIVLSGSGFHQYIVVSVHPIQELYIYLKYGRRYFGIQLDFRL